eukprot:Colp12_sorted_trinity150504_noHs@18259
MANTKIMSNNLRLSELPFRNLVIYFIVLSHVFTATALEDWCERVNPATFPPVLTMDPGSVACLRENYYNGYRTTQALYLVNQANLALQAPLYTIVNKSATFLPPSGDVHDYYSWALYYHPADGCDRTQTPAYSYMRQCNFVLRDGNITNADLALASDRDVLRNVAQTIYNLAFGFHFTKDEQYPQAAVRQIRSFFLDPATRMNPNMNFAQMIRGPGNLTSSLYALMDAAETLPTIMDAITIMNASSSLVPEVKNGFAQWLLEFTTWALSSSVATASQSAQGQLSTWYAAQVSSYLVYLSRSGVGGTINNNTAYSVLQSFVSTQYQQQITSNGSLPFELTSAQPFESSCRAVNGLIRAALVGDALANVSLWLTPTAANTTLRDAVQYLIPIGNGTATYMPNPSGQVGALLYSLKWVAPKYGKRARTQYQQQYVQVLMRSNVDDQYSAVLNVTLPVFNSDI